MEIDNARSQVHELSRMGVLRTPEERFEHLPDFAFAPHYVEVADGEGGMLRVHYLDEGPSDGPPVLLLHGEPTWSYVYHRMIPVLTAAGLRAVAPDTVGFGRSDKPAYRRHHTYQRHVDWLHATLHQLDLQDITLVGQEWGGVVGLRVAVEHPARFARIVATNTFLPTGDNGVGPAFHAWRRFSQEVAHLPVGGIVRAGCTTDLDPSVVAAYDAPFPSEAFKAGPRQLPMLVPTSRDDPAAEANRRTWDALARWDKPFLTAFSDADPITYGRDREFQWTVPGAANQPHTIVAGAGHFLQEDRGEELASVVADFVARTS